MSLCDGTYTRLRLYLAQINVFFCISTEHGLLQQCSQSNINRAICLTVIEEYRLAGLTAVFNAAHHKMELLLLVIQLNYYIWKLNSLSLQRRDAKFWTMGVSL